MTDESVNVEAGEGGSSHVNNYDMNDVFSILHL